MVFGGDAFRVSMLVDAVVVNRGGCSESCHVCWLLDWKAESWDGGGGADIIVQVRGLRVGLSLIAS